jgi:hypothetical protein
VDLGTQVPTKISSVFVHAADGYLHIATEAIEMIQVFPQNPAQRQYGRSIDPWCFDNSETIGTMQNKNFWSCGLTINSTTGVVDITNKTEFLAVRDKGYGNTIMNFTAEAGSQYAVVGPTMSPSEADWQATSYAISSQCAPIPATACDIQVNSTLISDLDRYWVPFNCSIARGSPVDFSGNYTGDVFRYTFFDFHKHLLQRGIPFNAAGLGFTPVDEQESVIPNMTKQEGSQMFSSTWRWTAAIDTTLTDQDSLSKDLIGKAWPMQGAFTSYILVVACNTTGEYPLPKSAARCCSLPDRSFQSTMSHTVLLVE